MPVIDTPLNTQIVLDDLTNANKDGVFDSLFASVGEIIQQEYNGGRIQGTDYANVLLGSISVTMEQAIQFSLQKDQAGHAADLVIAQIQQADEQSYNLEEQRKVITNQAKSEMANALVGYQKFASEQAQTKDTLYQFDETGTYTGTPVALQGILAQTKLQAEKNVDVIDNQVKKILEESALLRRKRTTEEAQTTTTPNVYNEAGVGTSITVDATGGGVIGHENALRKKQTDGFQQDANQKALKIMLDSLAISVNASGSGADVANAGFNAATISDVITKAVSGVKPLT